MKIQPVSIRELSGRKDLRLSAANGIIGAEKEIFNSEINRPGLALAGFTGRFTPNRIQILGETEYTYLASLSAEARVAASEHVLSFGVPCVIITKTLQPPRELLEVADKYGTAVLITELTTDEFLRSLAEFLEPHFAPRESVHATLVDVYGIGLLVTGRSGIGKSETALDLVERGHRLVADDLVSVYRMRQGVLMGGGNEQMQHYMEIRGIGIIDVPSLFGIRSIRIRKRVEVVIRLEEWDSKSVYERVGIEEQTTTILGVELPYVVLPIVPGKNLTVVAEVIALNHLLKVVGKNSAAELNDRLIEAMRKSTANSIYDREDFE
jgi:HPr kinase/phosphorylase